MAERDKIDVVHGYIEVAHEESRVAAAERYIAEGATITVNGMELSRAEYLAELAETDRFFVPKQTDIHRTITHGDTVTIFVVDTLEQVDSVYGVEPRDEPLKQHLSLFYRIPDDEIVELEVVFDQASKFRHLGLLAEDPTKEQLQNQYYEVLNRVLRHDLRNRLNVIRLHADSLAEASADDPTVAGVKIRDVVDELLETTDKARALEQLAIDSPVEPTSFPLDSLIEPIVERYAEYTETSFTTAYPDAGPPVVTTDKKLLWNALSELLENATMHNDADEPVVSIDVEEIAETRYEWEIQVEDNGPRIPEDVLQPILESRESQLLHGSGFGLWIVKWCLTRLDGDLAFEQPDSGGTRVRLLLPNLA